MKDGVAFIAFSLNPTEDCLNISMRTGSGVALNRIVETSMSDLELLNQRGLEYTAMTIGKFVLATLQAQHRDRFEPFPNLHVPVVKLPTAEQLARSDKDDEQSSG